MLGEVIDEDDSRTGERREGLYNGVFTFLRKLGGALGVFLVMGLLDVLGYPKGEEQSETARQAIRWMTGVAPACFLIRRRAARARLPALAARVTPRS